MEFNREQQQAILLEVAGNVETPTSHLDQGVAIAGRNGNPAFGIDRKGAGTFEHGFPGQKNVD